MTLTIALIVAVLIVRGMRAVLRFLAASKRTKTTVTTVVQPTTESPQYAVYTRPTFLRRTGPDAQRVRDDLAEFRKDIDGDVDDDWIDRLIRRQIDASSTL
jgi:hypothetical protein